MIADEKNCLVANEMGDMPVDAMNEGAMSGVIHNVFYVPGRTVCRVEDAGREVQFKNGKANITVKKDYRKMLKRQKHRKMPHQLTLCHPVVDFAETSYLLQDCRSTSWTCQILELN